MAKAMMFGESTLRRTHTVSLKKIKSAEIRCAQSSCGGERRDEVNSAPARLARRDS